MHIKMKMDDVLICHEEGCAHCNALQAAKSSFEADLRDRINFFALRGASRVNEFNIFNYIFI